MDGLWDGTYRISTKSEIYKNMAMLGNLLLRMIVGIITSLIAISLIFLISLIMLFFPLALIWTFARQCDDKAEVTKAYNTLMKRYYQNNLFQSEV